MIYRAPRLNDLCESCTLSLNRDDLKSFSDDDLKRLDSMVSVNHMESSINEYKICIPKAYAREEVKEFPEMKELESVPCYELYIENQVGSSRTLRSTYIFWKLPKTGRLVAIELFSSGGVAFKRDEHKFIIRETDELDRRIVLGFCLKHSGSIISASHGGYTDQLTMQLSARRYKASDMPKRLKQGPMKRSPNVEYIIRKIGLEPYEEKTIFSNVALI